LPVVFKVDIFIKSSFGLAEDEDEDEDEELEGA
jgi:hypothetical protein